jgi:mono/diheme cytochrome c family protein
MNDSKNLAVLFLLLLVASTAMSREKTDAQTGLIIDQGFETVKQNCTACHSARLITQSGATRTGWKESIRWMQKTQNLWQFPPETEKTILDYLAKNYAPPHADGRRAPLVVDKWYRLDVRASKQ